MISIASLSSRWGTPYCDLKALLRQGKLSATIDAAGKPLFYLPDVLAREQEGFSKIKYGSRLYAPPPAPCTMVIGSTTPKLALVAEGYDGIASSSGPPVTLSIGTPAPDRNLVVLGIFTAVSTAPGMTIDGQAIPLLGSADDDTTVAKQTFLVGAIPWPTGTTADFISNVKGNDMAFAVFSVHGVPKLDKFLPTIPGISNTITDTIDVPAGGVLLAAARSTSPATTQFGPTISWTGGGTIQDSRNLATLTHNVWAFSSEEFAAATQHTITCTATSENLYGGFVVLKP